MKTLSDYTIYCTKAQARKARELGASIEVKTIEEAPKDWQGKAFFTGMATCAKYPTAEQMIGWLEEQESIKSIVVDKTDCWQYVIWGSNGNVIWCDTNFKSRLEATLAVIDTALEYLSNKP